MKNALKINEHLNSKMNLKVMVKNNKCNYFMMLSYEKLFVISYFSWNMAY